MSPAPTPSDDALSRSISPNDLPDPLRSLTLLAEAQAGNQAALEELLRRYQHRLQRIVRIQLGSSTLRRDLDSMDIVQSTFKAALPKIVELRPASAASLLRWLALIATNQFHDHATVTPTSSVTSLTSARARKSSGLDDRPAAASPTDD
jgi:DNA-directed RNA polymerase specialized sigma24 family protein